MVRQWSERVDNWCHSDMLSGIYSRVLEASFEEVYPQLQAWNASQNEWLRRMSITSLIHYGGRNAVFLPPEQMLPLVANCAADHRKYVELAVGWVLREVGYVYPDEVAEFLERHAAGKASHEIIVALIANTTTQTGLKFAPNSTYVRNGTLRALWLAE